MLDTQESEGQNLQEVPFYEDDDVIKLFQFLISGCWHRWETMGIVGLNGNDGARGERVKLRCERCGTWTKKDLI